MKSKDQVMDELLRDYKQEVHGLWATFVQEKLLDLLLLSPEKRCKSCKHWRERTVYKGSFYCNHDKLDNCDDADGLKPIYDDGEHLCVTGPDFGCIHWEGKS